MSPPILQNCMVENTLQNTTQSYARFTYMF